MDLGADRPTPSTSISARESSALEALLVDLGSQIQRGTSISAETDEALRFRPTGITALDAHLGGGFPVGRLCEICGPPSSGRTALALALLTETLERGVLAAWIDLANAFDPVSAFDAGHDLERLLWVRARREDEALRSCERLLQTEGFELIVLDCASPDALPEARRKQRTAIRDVSWLRMARLAASTRTTLVALSNATATGSRAELVLEMKSRKARFQGPPSLFDALETTATLRRHRSRPTGRSIGFSILAETDEIEPGECRADRSGRR